MVFAFCLLPVFQIISGAQVPQAEVIDRMVAVVDGEVVTAGDIEDYRSLAEYFGDMVSASDDVILNQIIEDMLIARQIAQFPGNAIREAELDTYLTGLGEPGELDPALIRQEARRRLELERYYQSLTRSLGASDEEVRAVYENEFVPQMRERGEGEIPALAQVRAEIQAIVVAGKLDEEISIRLDNLYRRYRVEIVE